MNVFGVGLPEMAVIGAVLVSQPSFLFGGVGGTVHGHTVALLASFVQGWLFIFSRKCIGVPALYGAVSSTSQAMVLGPLMTMIGLVGDSSLHPVHYVLCTARQDHVMS